MEEVDPDALDAACSFVRKSLAEALRADFEKASFQPAPPAPLIAPPGPSLPSAPPRAGLTWAVHLDAPGVRATRTARGALPQRSRSHQWAPATPPATRPAASPPLWVLHGA
jgi:hypothetical protein